MISCLHSSNPMNNEKEREMRAGPIWNNRIPFAIVCLSVSLFLDPTSMSANAYRYSRVCACVCTHVITNMWTQTERKGRERRKNIRTRVRVFRSRNAVCMRIYGSLNHYAFCPSARLQNYAAPLTYSSHAWVYTTCSSILVENAVVYRQRGIKKS